MASDYDIHSNLQSHSFHAYAKPYLAEAISLIDIRPPPHPPSNIGDHGGVERVAVADFGCAYGANALDYAAFVAHTLLARRRQSNGAHADLHLHLHYFFADLPSNDFNSLFRSLPSRPILSGQQLLGSAGASPSPHSSAPPDSTAITVYPAGVPGSFYSRLFPPRTLSLAVSAYTLHWLSQVPPEVLDPSSPSWNAGHVYLHGRRPAVVAAYARQFRVDVSSFLRHRAHEMISGGILFLYSICRTQEHPSGSYLDDRYDPWVEVFEFTWNELVNEGVIKQRERDTFNVPFYWFHRTELEAALQEVCELKVLIMDILDERSNFPKNEIQKMRADPHAFGRWWKGFFQSLTKPLIENHIGASRATCFFERLEKVATQNVGESAASKNMTHAMIVAICKRI